MSEKNIKSRIVHKHDTEINWNKSSFIPKQGELIIYDIDSTYNYERFKIGDGSTLVNSLPFADDAVKTLIDTKVESVKDLVGDTSVSSQISAALVAITNEEIDTICETTVESAEDVTL